MDFIAAARALNVTAHVTNNEGTPLQPRPQDHATSRLRHQPKPPMAGGKGFGWLTQTGPIRQVKLRGVPKVDWLFVFIRAAHNLMRLPRLIAQRRPQGLREQCA